jgi:hypothetical protein
MRYLLGQLVKEGTVKKVAPRAIPAPERVVDPPAPAPAAIYGPPRQLTHTAAGSVISGDDKERR